LNYRDAVQVKPSASIDMPIYVDASMEIGAISLIMNYPDEMMQIEGVYLANDPSQAVPYAIHDHEIRIGWHSLSPLRLNAGETLLTLKVKVAETFIDNTDLRFSIAYDPLNELADGSYTAINPASLSMDMLKTSALGGTELPDQLALVFKNQPNPFKGTTTFAYSLPMDGKVSLELRSMLGSNVTTLVDEAQPAGDYSLTLDASTLEPGVYTATLRLYVKGTLLERTIKIVRQQ
jgi:hypothetical protein